MQSRMDKKFNNNKDKELCNLPELQGEARDAEKNILG